MRAAAAGDGPVLLDVMAWGGDPLDFPWFERPPDEALRAALDLLVRLGLVHDGSRRLTPLGERVRLQPLLRDREAHLRADGELHARKVDGAARMVEQHGKAQREHLRREVGIVEHRLDLGQAAAASHDEEREMALLLRAEAGHVRVLEDVRAMPVEADVRNRVPDLVQENVGGWLRSWLAENNLELEDVASWAVHPGGPRILSAVEAAAGIGKERTAISRAVLAEYGNMSSATVLFTLDRLRSQNAQRPCVALALGPGLVAEAVLIV